MDKLSLKNIFRVVRKPFLYSLLFAVLFFLILFPSGDLSDLVSSKIAEVTNNQVFLQFNEFSFGLLPPSIEFEDVFLESPFTPGLRAEEITLKPSLTALFSQRLAGALDIKGLFQGEMNLSLKKGTPTEAGAERQKASLEIEKVNLAQMKEAMKISILPEGLMSLTAEGQADLEFAEQPEVDLKVEVEKFALPPTTLNTYMGPLTLPDFKLAILQMKGRLSEGKFIIENGTIGKKLDDLAGTLKGFWGVQLLKIGNRTVPTFGAYDIEINFIASKAFESRAALFLQFIDQYKTATPEGSRFHFRVSGSDLNAPPNITGPR